MTVLGNPEDFECAINIMGNTVKVQKVTDSSFDKYGDETETTGDFVNVKAVMHFLNFEDKMVQEGVFQSGDVIFYFAANEVGECSLDFGNKIIHHFTTYEIFEVIPHEYDDTLYVYEVRARKT